MAIEHHRRNLAWLRPGRLTPHTLFALMAYLLGWSAALPFLSNDLEVELVARGIPPPSHRVLLVVSASLTGGDTCTPGVETA